MKRIIPWFLAAIFVLIIGAAFVFLYNKSKSKPTVFQTETAETADITKKTVATGSIVPRRSIEVKPKVTGVLTELFVEPGAKVKIGDPLGKVSIVQDALQTNQAESGVRSAQIAFDNAKLELERNEKLFKTGVVADAELQKYRTDFALRKQELGTAQSNLQIAKEGATKTSGSASSLVVTATAPGMVIDVPVKVGYSVIQANNFNPGTTVATVADMDDMIFDGHVDEAEVAKIKEGMKLAIKIGAIENETLDGKLEYISPQGKTVDGAIQFEIKAAVAQKAGILIRANYSANADIVLDEKKQVLAVREALVQYKDNQPFVEVETAPQTFVKHDVKLGLSDGIKVEVLSGVTKADKIKIPETAGATDDKMPKGPPHPPKK
ncbi:MAG TPA: efflux RND transporter periplasmic adaptor subunit [Kofleriaceae bacterium]|jgi:HlyD family secretion protein